MDKKEGKSSLETIPRDTIFAVLSYVAMLCFIPLMVRRDDAFISFHAKQGLVLFGIELVLFFLRLVPMIGEVMFVFGMTFCCVCSLVGIVKVILHQRWEMPLVYDIAEKLK